MTGGTITTYDPTYDYTKYPYYNWMPYYDWMPSYYPYYPLPYRYCPYCGKKLESHVCENKVTGGE